MKTFDELCQEAADRTDVRVIAESPSITDTPVRRFAVFRSELAELLAAHTLPVDLDAVREAGERYAFAPQVAVPEPVNEGEGGIKPRKKAVSE